MAAAPLDRPAPRRDRTTDQPDRARVDALLRGVLPLRAQPRPTAHQRLPDALAPRQAQAAATHEEGQSGLATHHRPAPQALRPLGMGIRVLVDRMTRAR